MEVITEKKKLRKRRLRLTVNQDVYETLDELCFIKVDGMRIRVDKINALAGECLLRGLRDILIEKGLIVEKLADASARGESSLTSGSGVESESKEVNK